MNIDELLEGEFHVSQEVIGLCRSVDCEVECRFREIDEIAAFNQLKVLAAMQRNKLSDIHFAATTGYGYNDLGRDTLEAVYADVFHTELGLVRPQIISGTHALTVALFGNLRHGDEVLSPVGRPYDTLEGVIGIRPTKGSLAEHGVQYRQVDLLPDGMFDYEGIATAINDRTKLVTIQRSKGYAWRQSFTVAQIKELIEFIKGIRRDIICMVDNCYGEFVDISEPSDAGADLVVGSLIKNPGGGLAPVGGYICGVEEYVENAAYRLTAPGLGREVGPTLGVTQQFMQGLFLAPTVVASSLKGAVFAAAVFEKLGYDVLPGSDDVRSDIVQAIRLGSADEVISFCRGIQAAAPVDSFVVPHPAAMPGYDCPVIMAAGSFVQGSSIELSADAPIKPPYTVYLQGGLTWAHSRFGVVSALDRLVKDGLIKL